MKTKQDLSEKPYYRCLDCNRFRSSCGGRPTRDMDLQAWCEYMRDVKEHFHLTNAYIAKEAEVSIKTIEWIMAVNIEHDIMRATARSIELAVIGPVGEHTCYLDHNDSAIIEQMNRLQAAVEHLSKETYRYAKIIDKYLD